MPPGLFEIDLRPDPNRIAHSSDGHFLDHDTGIDRVPVLAGGFTWPNWGTWRARMQRISGKSFGRDNVYLHDSGKGFSRGCIECRRGDSHKVLQTLIDYRGSGHTSIRVRVRYNTTSTRENTRDTNQ